jgi:hypothetical protein
MIKPFVVTRWLAVMVLLCGSVTAQPEATAKVVGSISNSEGPLADVAVLIKSSDRQWNTRSNQNGGFNVELPAGTYEFILEREGFMKASVIDFKVAPGTVAPFRYVMEKSRGVEIISEYVEPEGPVSTSIDGPITLSSVPQSAPNISVNGFAATDKVQRGHVVQVAVVMDIPGGYHVNSNRPLESFLKATQLKIEAGGGRVGPVAYPRAVLRKFSFSNDKLSVYEGRVILRFSVAVPASFKAGSLELKAKLNYQSCSDALCFPPQSRDVRVQIPVVAATESVKRINSEYFGRGR